MIKKELRDILKSALAKSFYTFVIITILKIFLLNMDYFQLLTTGFGILIFWICLNNSYKIYKYEVNDHAWEYLLSLPLSRWKIIFIKIVPRFVIISILLMIYVIAVKIFYNDLTINNDNIFHPYLLIPVSFGALLSSLVIKISETRDKLFFSILGYASIGSLIWLLTSFFRPFFGNVYEDYYLLGCFVVAFSILGLIYTILFLRYFKSFDLKQSNISGRAFIEYATPYLLSLIFICVLMVFFRVNNIL